MGEGELVSVCGGAAERARRDSCEWRGRSMREREIEALRGRIGRAAMALAVEMDDCIHTVFMLGTLPV
jgi:hypothetical protein